MDYQAGPVTQRNTYNLQGWLTGTDYFSRYGSTRPDTSLLRESLFSSILRYYDPQHRQSVPSFTGNVSEWYWTYGNPGGTAEPQMSMYRFSYDGASRLIESSYGNRLLTTERNSETGISYDRNGNLLTLWRYGTSGTPDHELSYSYDGNRLVSLSDKKKKYAFDYDSNGNLVFDSRKGLTFGYNALNLLKEVKDSDGVKRAVYAYASDGTKLTAVDNSVSGYEYVGPFVYRRYRNRLTLESTAFTGGWIMAETASQGLVYRPIYFLADHLGSVRVVLDSSGKVLERNDYYPFGTRWTMPPQAMTDNRYRYEGKEEQQLAGINLLDYGSRLYDPFRGQWTSQDPLSENYYSHSPYSFCANNPIAILDPNGEDWYRLWLDPEQQEEEEEKNENERKERQYRIMYTELTSQEELDKAGIKGEYMGRAVVVFRGSRNERLGEGDNLFGKGAVLADVTVYGPKGEDDIGHYKGYTMSSNPEKFGVVAEGEYEVNKLIPGKREPLPSNWAVNNAERVPAMNNFNPAYPERNPGYLEGVYIHRSNLSGYAGITSSGGGISEGCLLIAPYQYTNGVNYWDRFNKQLKSLDRFLMILNR